MKLELYLRSEVNQKIRPLFLKDECEHCGCTEDLHLHHQYEFFQIVDNVLNKLQLEMKDTEEYTEYELYLIKSCVLAEHLKDNYLTLCSECHRKEHENNHKRRNRNDIKRKVKAEETKANVKEWLDAHMNDWFNKEVFNELVNIINRHAGANNNNQIKSFSKVKSYLELELKMNLEKTRKTVKGKKDTYYMITKTNRRIDLLESVIGKRLTTAEFKELAQELNFTNPKNGRLIANPKDEITELGYKVNDKKSNGTRFKVITK